MCEICEMLLLEEHRLKDDPDLVLCRKCRIFRRQPGNKTCYHCYVKHNLNEHCPICDSVPTMKM